MTTYIATGELTSLTEAHLIGVLSNVINSYHCVSTSYPHVKGQPAKRARTDLANAGNCARVGLSRRIRGRLSALPTMPLDILFEIFAHLHPSDLLSLCRVNKALRNMLLSRTSSYLWNVCLKLCGSPVSPVDMSPPAWSHLLFGGAYCHSCGAKPVSKVLFSLRRRACKSCMTTHLRCSREVPQEFRAMIRFDSGCAGNSIHPSRSWCTMHWWDEDVTALTAELDALKNRGCGPDGAVVSTDAAVSEFFARKKNEVAANTEHALICAAWEKDRNTDRSNLLSDARVKRFEDIKARFLPLGYSEEDMNQLRRHREVRISKPMSNRVWLRVEPLLRPGINKARDQRLMREGGEDYRERRQLVVGDYANFLKTLPPILLSLSPTVTHFLCENGALADALALGGGPDDPPLTFRIAEVICGLRPELERRKQERATLLRSLLPDVPEDATDDEAVSLATSVYECFDCRLPTSGLYMLAHDCEHALKPNTLHPQLSEIGRETVEMLLQLLGLGKETTALELDRRNDKFVCMRCSRGSFPQNGRDVLGRCVRDWRSCITHAIGARNERWHKGNPKWHLVEAAEMAGLSWEGFSTTHAYGCLHCPTRIDPSKGSVQWYTEVRAVREHVQKEHGKNQPLEGEDFFFNYSMRRLGCRSLLAMDR